MSNILLDVSTNFIDFFVDPISTINLNWIGKIIQWLIEGIGIVGVGIIVFTLILKTITLPLDVYSRVKMKKQSLVMKKMRPQMEKLQQQYANDQQMYSQKVMELQKQNGISMVGACVPMIVTLIIFMIVFSAFSTYSQYTNLSTYNDMVNGYNVSVQDYVSEDYKGNRKNQDGFLIECIDESLINISKVDLDLSKIDIYGLDLDNLDINLDELYTGSENLSKLKDKQKAKLKTQLEEQLKEMITKARVYVVDFEAFEAKIESDKNLANGFNSSLFKDLYASLYSLKVEDLPENLDIKNKFGEMNENERFYFVRGYVKRNARVAAADYYRENKNNFLWIKNIWYPDSPLNKEIPDFSSFNSTISRAVGSNGLSATYESSYDEVTYYLRNPGYEPAKGKLEGSQVNGYFILIILAIGLMFLQQFISMRSQKDANELGTVDGSGAKTNKWMLIMMPIIYGVFSFLYSAAFSLYMITNTLYGLVTTLVINKAMDVSFVKQEANGGYNTKHTNNNRKRLK